MASRLSTIDEAIAAIRRGELIIVMDDEDRENEGDLICAAETVTPEHINFMVTHGRGMVCMPVLPELCAKFDLGQMVQDNTAPLGTAFTVTVDHISCKTGITAQERAATIRALADPKSKITDFVRPGHIFPLEAKEGGVLRRAGHTESVIDLTRLAGMRPCGVLCEILDDTGNRANTETLMKMAEEYRLKIITVADLIKYRRQREKIVDRAAEASLPTKFGLARIIAYKIKYETGEPVALVYGDLTKVEAPLVRLHSSCFTGDLVDSLRCDCGDQLRQALAMIQKEGQGVLVYLPQEGRGIGLTEKIKAYALQDQGLDTCEANLALGYGVDLRDYGVGIQILKDLGLHKIRLMTNNSKKTDAFIYGGFDLEVVDQIPIVTEVNPYNRRYLETKRDKMGHALP
ncbi:MAG: 3,4-dihydroxy-2-butanone-4-phosphate synthase [Thermoguttaceae bacterium]|nr:3,4-dihydroxy-2-butanone-4-phosphate synthase [Thermoguttaceae bacterium]MBQ3333320.1 3,4-dihydroxy-2-butanone-4-phosphate synthase [Thermoguttaceae bacterium]MBQ6620861.1 3,4-dihydroxy-2-butanone-4-phosphate synthase [Thermoguttaceae bacterium]